MTRPHSAGHNVRKRYNTTLGSYVSFSCNPARGTVGWRLV